MTTFYEEGDPNQGLCQKLVLRKQCNICALCALDFVVWYLNHVELLIN